MLTNECVLKDQLDSAKNLVALGVVLFLICILTLVRIGFQYWEVWGILVLGGLAVVEGVNLYFKSKRGTQKCS